MAATWSARVLIRWLRVSARLPLPLLHGLAQLIGCLLWALPNRERRVARINLDLCFPELPAAARRRLLRRSLVESAKAMLELGPLLLRPGAKTLDLVRGVAGEDHWRAALTEGGAIVVTPHLGAWELCGLYVSSRYPLTAMYRSSRQGYALDTVVKQARERLGARLVRADGSGVRALVAALRGGGVVGILPDQDPNKQSGLFAPFFGVPAFTMVLVSRLASKLKIPVFLVHAERLPAGRGYQLNFQSLPKDLADVSPERSVAMINAAVETAVRRCPSQYLWSYKRFKTRPPGSAKFY